MQTLTKPAIRVGIGVWIKKETKVLMGFRIGSHSSGVWAPPGGHIEFGESFEETALREVKEETGLEINNIKVMGVLNNFYEEEQNHVITTLLTADWVSGEPQLLEPDKMKEWRWVEWGQFPDPLMKPVVSSLEQGLDPFKV
jgi:8-oxo-dGTP diphosphatase